MTLVALVFARRERRGVLVVLHLLRLAVLRGRDRRAAALGLRGLTGVLLRAAGYQRRAVLVGTGEHIEAVAHALRDSAHTADQRRRLHLAHAAAGQRAACRSARWTSSRTVIDRHRIDEVIIADPDFPEDAGGRARRPVPRAAACGCAIAPSTMEMLVHRAEFVPGEAVPLFELKPPVFEGFDYVDQAHVRPRRSPLLLLVVLSPLLLACALAVRRQLARAGDLPLHAPGHRRRAVRVPEVPHDVPRRRPAPGGPRVAQRGDGRAVQDPRRPADDAGRPLPAPLLARRAAAALQRPARRDVARRPAPAARSATSSASRTGTRSATSSCRASPGCGRSRAARSWTSTTSCGSTSSTSSAGRSSST